MFIKSELLLFILSFIVLAGIPLASEGANLADYVPLSLGSHWTYQNVANASDIYTVSVFEQFIFNGFNGQPAVKFSEVDPDIPSDYSIGYNNGTCVNLYGSTEQGIIWGISIGNFTDGAFFSTVDPEDFTSFTLLRMYDNLDPELKSVYGINPSLTNLVLWVSYDDKYPPNSQNNIVESNLGFTIPYAVTHLEWYATGVGKIVDLDIGASSGAIEKRYELIDYNIVPEPICTEKPVGDFNGDCKVDFEDFALFANNWLECNLDPPSACW